MSVQAVQHCSVNCFKVPCNCCASLEFSSSNSSRYVNIAVLVLLPINDTFRVLAQVSAILFRVFFRQRLIPIPIVILPFLDNNFSVNFINR